MLTIPSLTVMAVYPSTAETYQGHVNLGVWTWKKMSS